MSQYKPHVIEEQPETGIERHWRDQEEREQAHINELTASMLTQYVLPPNVCAFCKRYGCQGQCLQNMGMQ